MFILGYFGIGLVSVITIAATTKRKALHDFITNTLVLRGRLVPERIVESWRIALALGVPIVWMVGTFLAIM